MFTEKELESNCCGAAPAWQSSDLCSRCLEHADMIETED